MFTLLQTIHLVFSIPALLLTTRLCTGKWHSIPVSYRMFCEFLGDKTFAWINIILWEFHLVLVVSFVIYDKCTDYLYSRRN